jgi:hypothetical protein
MENAKKFFEEVVKTEEAKELFKSAGSPETEEARIAAYIDVAAKLGVALSADEIKAYYASSCTSDAQEIDDKELSQLAGGGDNANCKSTYQHRENCWWNDACDMYTNDYDGYKCASRDYGKKPGSTNRTTMIFK